MIKLGKAFSDNVIVSKTQQNRSNNKFTGWGVRITFFYVLLVVSFFLLGLRLFHLTIVEGNENRSLSEGNRIRTSIIHAPRGTFYDRKGIPLSQNIPAVRVSKLCKEGDSCKMDFMTLIEWKEIRDSYGPAILEQAYMRAYPKTFSTAHVLGYLNEITQEEVKNPLYSYQDYGSGDTIGRMGLEVVFEKKLRGINGKELIEVNSSGQTIRTLGKIDASPGQDLYLTLDIDLQKVAYEAMGEYTGAVVVSKPKTGEILALVSVPSFNPNEIHKGLSDKLYNELFNGEDKPLFNRAVSGVYPPGSTFKPVVAIAALESGKVTRSTTIEDSGKFSIGEFSFSNWYFTQYGKTDGQVSLIKGLARSNDIYFYKIGEMTGVEDISNWGKRFGIGRKTGIELFGEAEGVMPDPGWRKIVRNEKWYLGDTYHLAIGQGDLQVTPLQLNQVTQTLANNGVLCPPTLLVQKSKSSKPNCTDLKIKPKNSNDVREGMRRACDRGDTTGYQGTGWPLFDFTVTKETFTDNGGKSEKLRIPLACKTGTAETGDSGGHTHAWFTAYAPLQTDPYPNSSMSAILGDPEIAVTVLVEKGGEGSSVAAPVAKKILQEWFKR